MGCGIARDGDSVDRSQGRVANSVLLAVLALALGCSPNWDSDNRYLPAAATSGDHDFAASSEAAVATASNAAMSLDFAIDRRALQVSPRAGSAVELRFSGFGRVGAIRVAPPIRGAIEVQANRVRLPRQEGLDEWYLHGPRGLEQGFTLQRPPRHTSKGQLVLALTVRGARPAKRSGKGIHLRVADSRMALRYTNLVAHDATGQVLPSSMHAVDQQIELHVDDSRAFYPVVVDPLVWQETDKLIATDGNTDDLFGTAVALHNTTAVVGAPKGGDYVATDEGAAYVFSRSGDPPTWSEQTKLVANDGKDDDRFGAAVAIHDDTVVVGAPKATFPEDSTGKAYVFTLGSSSWELTDEVVADDGVDGDKFGSSLAFNGKWLVIGAPAGGIGPASNTGSVYVFEKPGSIWKKEKELTPDKAKNGDDFGRAVALSGYTVLVGAPNNNVGGTGTSKGAAYVFVKDKSWYLSQTLTASDGAAEDGFGTAVALDGDTALIGAPGNDEAAPNGGAVYVFTRSGQDWTETTKLIASIQPGDAMGAKVALLGDVALLSAPNDKEKGDSAGAVHVFRHDGGSWMNEQKLVASDGHPNGFFANAVALSGSTAILGSPGDTEKGAHSGSAYVLQLALSNGEPCTHDDKCHSRLCVQGVCCESEGVCGALGTACIDNTDCASEHCVDGVCCDSACADPCDACNLDGAEGSCTLLAHGETAQPSCLGNHACDGQSATCPETCADDDDCIPGFGCEASVCIDRQKASCDGHSIMTSVGTTVDCRPYRCTEEGPVCLTKCGSTLDCSSGNVCDAEHHCVPYQPPATGGSCDCRSAGRSRDGSGAARALLGLLGLSLARRRNR